MDRKSSRGMIYENEELRLRTININAEVERGTPNTIIANQKLVRNVHVPQHTGNQIIVKQMAQKQPDNSQLNRH